MTDYARIHNFTTKDSLAADNPAKLIKGSEVDAELDSLVVHHATKTSKEENEVVTGDWTISGDKTFSGSATFSGTVTGITATALSGLFPAGIMVPYGGTTEPTSWVFCDGSVYNSVSDTTFAALYTAIGNTYGGTDGTDFKVPDLRGRAVFGKDDMDGAGGTGGGAASVMGDITGGVDGDDLGAVGGQESHTLLTAEMPSHSHTAVRAVTTDSFSLTGGAVAVHTGVTASSSSSAGSGSAHPTIPPAIILNYIIYKAG